MCKVCGLDYRLRLCIRICFQWGTLVSYHFGKILLRFGVLTTEQNRKFEIAEHRLSLILAVNHIKVSQRLRQHHYTDMAFAQLAQGLGDLRFSKRRELVQAEQNHLCMLFWARGKILHRLRRDNAQQVTVDFQLFVRDVDINTVGFQRGRADGRL